MKAAAVKPSRRPIAHEGTSFVSASIATQVHTSPTPNAPFIDSGTFFAFAYTKAQISSHWIRRLLRFRSVSSWYFSQAAPMSSRSLVTVLMDTSARRLAARRLLPSANRPTIWDLRARGNLFMEQIIRTAVSQVKHKVQLGSGPTGVLSDARQAPYRVIYRRPLLG